MRATAETPLDQLVPTAVKKVAGRGPYFTKSEVIDYVANQQVVSDLLADLRKRHGKWQVDELVVRYLYARVAKELQARDANGIRLYECYPAGTRERRWLRLRSMTKDQLRAVLSGTRTRKRQLEIKIEGYEIFLDELEKLSDPNPKVGQVYDIAVPKIRALRASA